MQITPFMMLLTQASKLKKAGKVPIDGTMDVAELRRMKSSHRADLFEALIKQIGGELFTFFDKGGKALYAAGETAAVAAAYLRTHRYKDFVPAYYTTERLRSCGGKRYSNDIYDDAVRKNQWFSEGHVTAIVAGEEVHQRLQRLQDKGFGNFSIGKDGIIRAEKVVTVENDSTKSVVVDVNRKGYVTVNIVDPSAERDEAALKRHEKPVVAHPPVVVEHPLQRLWPVNAFGRW